MKQNIYTVKKINNDLKSFTSNKFWKKGTPLEIIHYMWMNNGYTPKVFAKLMYSENDLYLFFKVFEKKIRAQYQQLGDPVYKDSCVEFFFNPFPTKNADYFNFEINALGTMLIGAGESRGPDNRKLFGQDELSGFEIVTSLKEPLSGFYDADHWTVYYKIPLILFENYYQLPFKGEPAIGNFYKCGDDTEFVHYGAWNPIENTKPNFHLPQFFGKILFEQ